MQKKLNPQLLIALSVMLINLAALFVSMHQVSIMNKQVFYPADKSQCLDTLHLFGSIKYQLNQLIIDDCIEKFRRINKRTRSLGF